MSSQGGSQKLLQGLVCHELTAYLSIFNLFKLSELWPYYQRHVNQIILNHITFYFMAPFYGWGSTGSRLQPLRGASLLFTTQFPEIPGTHFIDLGRMKG